MCSRKEQDIGIVKRHATRGEFSADLAAQALQNIGGMAGSWRTDYPETTFFYPALIDGALVDLSTVEKVRKFYEAKRN